MAVKAVVFDIGNVLIRWDPNGFYDRAIGAARARDFFAQVPIFEMNARVDLGAPMKPEVTQLAIDYPQWADEIHMWHDHWLDILRPAIDHSVRLLRALRRNDVPVFALSNFGADRFEVARGVFPFLDEFDAAFISGQRKMMKPSAAFYEVLEVETGMSGSDLLFADDLSENIDVAAARGWQVHLFEGARGWAQCLVSHGLLSEEDAQ